MPELEQKQIAAQQVICLAHTGTYQEIGKVYHRLLEWAKGKKVRLAGKGFTIFHDPPSEIDFANARFEVCLPFTGQASEEGEIKVRQMPSTSVVFMQHKGSYATVPARYAEMLAWIDAQGYEITGPPREMYVKKPAKGVADSDDCVTEIHFPVLGQA